jgi:hypothetical protein
MTTLEQAELLRQQAISLLLQERETLDQKLGQLGYGGTPKEVKRTCSKCGAADHNSRSCPQNRPLEAATA